MHHLPSTETDKRNTLPKVPSRAEMGYLHLSFEYHKKTLKVRVWQISDLLLPPPQISMIHSIFVRAYFIPDKSRKSHRRTEDIIIDVPESGGVETPKTGIQHIFTPSSFKFRTPLLYRAVTEAVVKERSLQLEVCMTQKRSHHTFLMAMVHLPLSTAVRRPIREKYPLIPCMNITIPNNMRVYSAAQLQLESSKGSNSPSIKRAAVPAEEVPVTAREVELEDVVSLSGEDFLRSHLSLCLDEDSDNEGGGAREHIMLREVKVSNGVGSGGSSTTTLDIPSSEEERDDDDDNRDVPVVVTDKQGVRARSTPIDMSCVENLVKPNSKKKIIPNELLKVAQDVPVEMPSEDTVVNMDSSVAASVSAPQGNTHPRRKIIPAGLEYDFVSSAECRSESTGRQNIQRHDDTESTPSEQKVPGSPVVTIFRKKKVMVLPGKISIPSEERTSTSESSPRPSQRTSGSAGLSPESRRAPHFSPLQDSAFSPASRPETPCWDFYDWTEDLQAEEGMEMTCRTLDDSLAQLRQHGIGSLQNLSKEPVLPMDLADDFDSLTVNTETERL
ncbi:uncharacterized protein LOC143287519 isoform X2 [Babylonia areolata]